MLRIRAHGAFPDTYLGLAVGAMAVAAGVAMVAFAPCVETIVVALLCGVMAVMVAGTAIYKAWGTVVIDREGSDWVVSYQLGRWKRSVRFAVAQTLATERREENIRSLVVFEGELLLVHVAGRAQPVRIGGGFRLQEPEFRAIEELLAPGVNFR